MAKRNHSLEERRTRHIPTELHEEILLRLPARDIQKFKLVCKDWLRLISSPQFIHKHLYICKLCCKATRFLIPLPSEFVDYNYNASVKDIRKKTPYPPGFSIKNSIMLGSCDGLILCLVDEDEERNKLGVFNPSTGKYYVRIVDGIDFNGSHFYWFGRHPSIGEYVLVVGRILLSPIRVQIEVHKFCCNLKSLLSCSIERPLFCLSDVGTLLHGNLHWTVAELYTKPLQYKVLAYNFEKNEILEIAGPGESYFTLGVVDGCLSAMLNARRMSELWIMKEYGVAKSWTKYGNIDGYSFSDKEAALLKDQRIDSEAILCADSLVSPELIWGE